MPHIEHPIVICDFKHKPYTYYDHHGSHIVNSWGDVPELTHKIKLDTVKAMCKKLRDPTIENMYQYIRSQYDLMIKCLPYHMNPTWYQGMGSVIKDNAYSQKTLSDHYVEDVIFSEYEWLEKAVTGGYIDTYQKGIFDHVKAYDQKNSYNSVLMLPQFYIPTRIGDFEIRKNYLFQKSISNLSYGIYRCIVTGTHPFFRYNKNNYYTHFAIKIVADLGLKIDLIEDGQPNCLLWPQKKVIAGTRRPDTHFIPKSWSASRFVGDYIKVFNEARLKHPECTILKSFSSTLHGYLVKEHYEPQLKIGINDPMPELPKVCEIIDVFDDGEFITLTIINHLRCYETPLARLKPFLYDRQRLEMYEKVLKPFGNKIIKICIDGFLSATIIPAFENNHPVMGNICADPAKNVEHLVIDEHFKIVK